MTNNKDIKSNKCPIVLKGAINPDLSNKHNNNLIDGAIGYFMLGRNSVRSNKSATALFSTCSTDSGFSIMPSNCRPSMALFTAKKIIPENWINYNDGYYVPNTNHPDYEQWNNDAFVFSLYNTSSQQSSLRGIEHERKKYDIYNNFFCVARDAMIKEAKACKYQDLINDAINDTDRYIYNELKSITLSPDAKAILVMMCKLIIGSIKYRKEMNEVDTFIRGEGKARNLQCWDAGWYQVKIILNEKMPKELKEFNRLCKDFEDRMSEGVFKFGFLKERSVVNNK